VRVDPATGMLWVATDGGAGRFDPHYVPPAPPSAEHLRVRVYPNPAQLFSGIGVELRLDGNVSALSGTVYDLSGRRVRRFESANGRIFWDGRDREGNLVNPGIYFVRIQAQGREATARVALIR